MSADGAAAPTVRQNLLILYSSGADPASPVVAWSHYEGAPQSAPEGSTEEPPYGSVVAAMRDGWRVIQVPLILPPDKDDPYGAAHLTHEYVLEKLVEVEDR